MNKLLQECWEVLKKNPGLYTPPLLLLILSAFISPVKGESLSDFSLLNLLILFALDIAITTGWINQIKISIAGKEKSKFDDVLVGIGKYFSTILLGNIFLLLLLVISFMIYFPLVNKGFIGISDAHVKIFEEMWKKMSVMPQQELSVYLNTISPEIKEISLKISASILAYAGIASVFYFFIGVWYQCCVIRGLGWFQSCKRSYKLVIKNIGTYTILILLESIFIAMFFVLTVFLKDAFTQILMTFIQVVVKTYFMVLFSLFVLKYDNDDKIDLIRDEIQPSIPEIQKSDNKE